MRQQQIAVAWVVYKMNLSGPHGANAVCEQGEWEEMERVMPGHHTLVRSGITNEAEAEKLARELPGGTALKGVILKSRH
jgi:hypothetical protein